MQGRHNTKERRECGAAWSRPRTHGEYSMTKKKAAVAATLLFFSLLLTGCDIEFTSGFGDLFGTARTEQEEVIPAGSYPTIRSSTIRIDAERSVTLPGTFHYATNTVEQHDSNGNLIGTYTAWYGYEKDVNYINPNDPDIMFYCFMGNDLTTPDKELTQGEANTSIAAYVRNFVSQNDQRSNPIVAANGTLRDISSTGQYYGYQYWVYPFYLYDKNDSINTTYNVTLYPKYYYGICLLDVDADSTPSRNWYLMIFSNDTTGKLIGEQDYTQIFEDDLKGQFGIADYIFPTQFTDEDVANRRLAGINTEENPLYVAQGGYDYERLMLLFTDTINYYQVLPNYKVEQPTPPPEGNVTEDEPAPVERRYTGLYAVLAVVDGDTLDVDVDGEKKRIRLIGIDTPESVNPDETLNTPEGEQASAHTKELLAQYNNFVYLEWGEGDSTDAYGRTLAYAYVTDGSVIRMLNRMLVEQGYARAMAVEPDTRYAADFEREQKRAQKAETGFWGTGFFTPETEGE